MLLGWIVVGAQLTGDLEPQFAESPAQGVPRNPQPAGRLLLVPTRFL